MKSFGYIKVNPADYVIVFKSGKILKEGRGLRFYTTPGKQYVIIPACVNNITFLADQITKENQGVEVSGFTIWKVGEPSKIYMNFDFGPDKDPMVQVNTFLKDVVESAIRHMVANMTIEEVLRKRGTIILQLKKELEYISGQWGIIIETIEIKNVKVLSAKLFDNMQAKYRDALKLESETSLLKTNKEIEEQKMQYAEKTAELQQQNLRTALEREKEIKLLKIKDELELDRIKKEQLKTDQIKALKDSLELFEKQEENKLKTIEIRSTTINAEKKLKQLEMELETFKKELSIKLEQMDLMINQERINIDNSKKSQLVLYEKLPEIVKNLNINNLNLGDDSLASLIVKVKEMISSNETD